MRLLEEFWYGNIEPTEYGIYVGAPDKSSGKRRQKIEIYYDGAGFIPLNLLMQRETA